MNIQDWLTDATSRLKAVGIPSPRLDAEVLLAHVLRVNKTWLVANGNEPLEAKYASRAETLLQRRLKREPIAYLIGNKEFYGRKFLVTCDTLVPRPETEDLVDLAKQYVSSGRLLDVGTGSGCLGLTLALETGAQLTVSDTSENALAIARKNAKALGVKPVRFVVSDLLEHWLSHRKPKPFSTIVANLPYVNEHWTDTSPELHHEPTSALYADDNGLALIKKLINQAPPLLISGGYLLLEADPTQHDAIITYAKEFKHVETKGYGVLLQK